MLVRFNKITDIGGATYGPESGDVDLTNDLANEIVRDGNGKIVGVGGLPIALGGGIVSKFLGSLANGENYRKQKSLLPPPAWVASKVYGVGSVVQNGGNVYLCINTFGAAAASGGPSGTGLALITDNVLKWMYMGAVDSVLGDTADAPVLTFAAIPGSATRRYNPTVAADAAAFHISGATYGLTTAWGGAANDAILATSPHNSAFSVDFVTDAPIVAFSANANTGNSSLEDSKLGAISFLINGTPMHKIGGEQAGANTAPGGTILDFSSKPRKARRIRAYWMGRQFTGVNIAPQYSIWKPYNPNRYRLVIDGDSTMRGADPTNSAPGNFRAQRLASMLGCDDVWCTAVGGSGFIVDSAGSTVLTRAAAVIAAAPDILYVPPIYNDKSTGGVPSTATRKAAYTSYFNTILAALPNCIIICGGGYDTAGTNILTSVDTGYQVELDMAAAISEYNHPNVKFLPSISEPSGRWLFGNGHIGTPGSTTGNADQMVGDGTDTIHPNQRFLEYVMWREYAGIVNIMNGLA